MGVCFLRVNLSRCGAKHSLCPPEVPLWPRKVPLWQGQGSAERMAKFCGREREGMRQVYLPFCHVQSAKGAVRRFGTVFVVSSALALEQAGYESDAYS